ncbi:hypothetical protein [Lewinella sp. LCG006]|uniref:hypothetical protein n=1 Tax=Lewinella sp. LCG006 TaxID=3231911 RepID=UPI00346123B2
MKSFFLTASQTINALKQPKDVGFRSINEEDISITKYEALARIGITILLLFIALYLFKSSDLENNYSEIASTIIGAIVGYWFR